MKHSSAPELDLRVFSVLLLVIVGLGGVLRLADLSGPSLWLDEILHLDVTRTIAAQDGAWWTYLFGVRETMGTTENGALYYALQVLGQRLAPGDPGVRLLPAIVGTATIALMALAGAALAGRRVALVGALLLAVSPLHVYFSREGRPYYLLMALALALLWALLERSRTSSWWSWVLCLGGAYIGLHAVPLLLAFLALSLALLWWDRDRKAPLLHALRSSPAVHRVAAAALALALAYGLYMTRSQNNSLGRESSAEQVAFQESPVFESPLQVKSARRFLASMTIAGTPSSGLGLRAWSFVVLISFGCVLGARAGRKREVLLALGMFVLPTLLSFSALAAVGRWYGIRYTSAALPAFLLLAALGLVSLAQKGGWALAGRWPQAARLGTAAIALALLVLVAAPNWAEARRAPYTKLDWRAVAASFDEVALPGEPILIPNDWPKICLDYYLQQRGRNFEFVPLWESAANGKLEVERRQRGWMLTAGYRRSNEVRAWMHGFVPVLKKREEEMALFFFPDLVTLLETRFAAGKGALFVRQFEEMGRRFDFGGGELTLQGWGWSYPEHDGAGTDFQWAIGEEAELGLPITQPAERTIRLRLRPFEYPDAPAQRVEVWLNETLLREIALDAGWSEHRVVARAADWSAAANILRLRFAHVARPAAVIPGSTDRRPLAAAFDVLAVEEGEEGKEALVDS